MEKIKVKSKKQGFMGGFIPLGDEESHLKLESLGRLSYEVFWSVGNPSHGFALLVPRPCSPKPWVHVPPHLTSIIGMCTHNECWSPMPNPKAYPTDPFVYPSSTLQVFYRPLTSLLQTPRLVITFSGISKASCLDAKTSYTRAQWLEPPYTCPKVPRYRI